MSKLTELKALRDEIKTRLSLDNQGAVEWIAGAFDKPKSPCTVWGWFNRKQLSPIPDDTLRLLMYIVSEI